MYRRCYNIPTKYKTLQFMVQSPNIFPNYNFFFIVTPLDVVKVRLQAQQKSASVVPKCFLYCNGLMDHICPCFSSSSSQTYWYSRPGHFSGTLVIWFFHLLIFELLSPMYRYLFSTLLSGCFCKNISSRRCIFVMEWIKSYACTRFTSYCYIFRYIWTIEK